MEIVQFNSDSINTAVEALNRGGVIIFPTDTVYGIGVLAANDEAVKKLYKMKARPEDKPFQVLISDINQVPLFADDVKDYALAIAKKYWPGPLTLVFKKKENISTTLTGGQDTIGLRMPGHPFLLELINRVGPLAASSANLTGQPAPIKVEDIKIEADLLLDGGECKVGVASTVVDVTGKKTKILRPGSIEIK